MKLKVLLVYALFLFMGAYFIIRYPHPPAKTPPSAPEQKAAAYLDGIRAERPTLLAFLRKMPKGGDLHSHLSGAVYAETFLRWAAEEKMCLDTETLVLSAESEATAQGPPRGQRAAPQTPNACGQGKVRLKQDLEANDPVLYRRMIDAWSMRNWEHSGRSGHDQFFDAFAKFGQATGRTAEMVAEVAKRAEANGVSYLELMLSLDGGKSRVFGDAAGWDGDHEATAGKLKKIEGYAPAVEAGLKAVYDAERGARAVLKCDESEDNPGCKVTVRYICQVARGRAPQHVFAQMLMAFEMADTESRRAGPRLVGVNLVQPEDGAIAMEHFRLHMGMLKYLQGRYPNVKITLHAGELAPGLVAPEALKSHIKESVEDGQAKRIGHGTDILHEDDWPSLLRKMADKGVMVEICLSSNDKILGVRGKDHPLNEYIKRGVPVALATDDEGVARSDMTLEYMKSVEEQGLGYLQLKKMARTSLEHAFVSGESLWSDKNTFEKMVPQCSQDDLSKQTPAHSCREFLGGSEKARLQWELEKALRNFESLVPSA